MLGGFEPRVAVGMLQNGVENPDDPETSTPFHASNYKTLDSKWAAVNAHRDSDEGAHISKRSFRLASCKLPGS